MVKSAWQSKDDFDCAIIFMIAIAVLAIIASLCLHLSGFEVFKVVVIEEDLNADGIPDCVIWKGVNTGVINQDTIQIEIAGMSPKYKPVLFIGTLSPDFFEVKDFNNDTYLDIAFQTISGDKFVLVGNGDGTFAEKTLFALED